MLGVETNGVVSSFLAVSEEVSSEECYFLARLWQSKKFAEKQSINSETVL